MLLLAETNTLTGNDQMFQNTCSDISSKSFPQTNRVLARFFFAVSHILPN